LILQEKGGADSPGERGGLIFQEKGGIFKECVCFPRGEGAVKRTY
jgi:hypothetical protein